MKIAGLQKTTLIDYPNKIACTVFTYGCNFRCPFCHNPELVTRPLKGRECLDEDEFFRFLDSRKKMLDGVVISGGEPCLNKEVVQFSQKVKDRGFLLKIDTNGSFPNVLEELLSKKLLDYIAMDIKAPIDKYGLFTGGFEDVSKILQSIEIIRNSNIRYEFRTTVVKGMHKKEDIEQIADFLQEGEFFSLQNFRHGDTLSASLGSENEFSEKELLEFKQILVKKVVNFSLKL